MKSTGWYLCLLMVTVSGRLGAQVYLEVPHQLEIKTIDGESPKRTKLNSKQRILELADGAHEVVVYFYNIYEDGEDDYISFRSNPVTWKFQGRAGQRFRLDFTPPLRSEVEKEDDVDVAIRLETLTGEPSPQAQPEASAKPKIPDLPLTETTKDDDQHVSKAVAEAADTAGLPLEMLQFWWKKATPKDRETFLNWARSLH